MQNQPIPEADALTETRVRVVEASLPHVVFDGWSEKTLDAALAEADADPTLASLAFPRGGPDLAMEFHRMMDRRLVERLANDPAIGRLKVREKIAYAVRCRLELVADHREAVRRAVTLFALPVYAPEGAKAIWETADTIWTVLGDDTPGHSATWGFLDRRIDEVMRFEKAKSAVTENPLAKAAMWGPTRLLDMLSGVRHEPNVPSHAPGPRTPPPAPDISQGPVTETPGGPPPPEH